MRKRIFLILLVLALGGGVRLFLKTKGIEIPDMLTLLSRVFEFVMGLLTMGVQWLGQFLGFATDLTNTVEQFHTTMRGQGLLGWVLGTLIILGILGIVIKPFLKYLGKITGPLLKVAERIIDEFQKQPGRFITMMPILVLVVITVISRDLISLPLALLATGLAYVLVLLVIEILALLPRLLFNERINGILNGLASFLARYVAPAAVLLSWLGGSGMIGQTDMSLMSLGIIGRFIGFVLQILFYSTGIATRIIDNPNFSGAGAEAMMGVCISFMLFMILSGFNHRIDTLANPSAG